MTLLLVEMNNSVNVRRRTVRTVTFCILDCVYLHLSTQVTQRNQRGVAQNQEKVLSQEAKVITPDSGEPGSRCPLQG